ncbi:daunorubicin resistance protein DrrA family ABC transporter ATP-binding protein [Actinomadura rubrobrunea]|uniref:Daunorubicin resistance protein DrrA family ABC transporter ATP-binding protein n=1 Tax=Actinomadura rubrobrunea TaxID=115335 RepID=A0A9W6PUL3_9ACTN|nr:ATP-binding cassette domain-containing protein [Actinomadura rubrobrunea]GLW63907.1 daunorubicin resistance protein DrrA family ABC transporter ATP-binding protein [Actinomadura rubrobrunea]
MSADGLAIEVRNLTKTYPDGVRALDGVTFEVPTGTVFGLLGPNGAGKSTTIKILTTLARPDSGRARVAGRDVVAEPARVRRAIGYVAQQSGCDPADTGRENLMLQGRLYGLGGRALRERADGLLERFGLTDVADRLVKTYSGGMRRKLDVAMGLVHEPRVLFLDEPTTGLDPEARVALWREIGAMARAGITVVLTTHYLEEADELADALAILDRGTVVAQGSPEGLKKALQGDSVQVQLTEPAESRTVKHALADVGGVHDIVVSGREVRARVDAGASSAPAVLSALESADLRVASVTLSAPTLDEVYLRHTGRSFRSAQEGDIT